MDHKRLPGSVGQGAASRLLSWLIRHARQAPQRVFIHSIDQNLAITYAEMLRLCYQIGNDLAARGIRANDRIALLARNSIEHLAAYLGVMAYGATICTIHVEMNATHLPEVLQAIRPRLVLFESGLGMQHLASAAPGVWMPLGAWRRDGMTGWYAEVAVQSGQPAWAPVNRLEDIASIFYTSGTASKPKGVICTFAELFDNVQPTADAFGLTAADRILDFRSFNWMSAQVLSALAPLCKGATLLLARQFSRRRFFPWIRTHGATIAAGNPTTINMLLNRPVPVRRADVPTLRFVTSSSAPLLVQAWKNFEARYGIPVAQGYGASEAGWIAASNERTRRLGSVGKPLAYQNLTVVNEAGEALPCGEIGAVELGREAYAVYRYLDDHGRIQVSARGRMRTGDLGYIDRDGYLYITGRTRELIIRGGVNIAPVEIDNVLCELDQVAEAATIGVPHPIYGEEVVAYVVPKPEIDIDAEEVLSHCRARLADAKVPKQIVLRASLPKTDRGKLDRRALVDVWRRTRDACA